MIGLALVSLLAGADLVCPVWCTTYEERTLGRLHTVCSDGTCAVSIYNRMLQRWETTVTPLSRPAHKGAAR